MYFFDKNSGQPLVAQVEDEIISMLRTETFPNNRLPPEKKLAERFGVSLSVVREALLKLSEKKIISKKRGSGNYIHMSTLNSFDCLDQFPGFVQQLSAQGYHATEQIVQLKLVCPSETVYHELDLQENEQIMYCERIIYADGKPAVNCEDYLPPHIFKKGVDTLRANLPILEILSSYSEMEIAHGRLEFIPYISTDVEAKQLGVEVGAPMVAMAATYFSLEDYPVLYSYNKINHKILKLKTFI